MNEFLTWLLDTVQSVDPVLRTLLAGLAIMLETSVLIGLFVPGDTIVIIAGDRRRVAARGGPPRSSPS